MHGFSKNTTDTITDTKRSVAVTYRTFIWTVVEEELVPRSTSYLLYSTTIHTRQISVANEEVDISWAVHL